MNDDKIIILYSTGCPRCEMLKQKLSEKEIAYLEENDAQKMLSLGIVEVPMLRVGDRFFDFRDAYLWANEQ